MSIVLIGTNFLVSNENFLGEKIMLIDISKMSKPDVLKKLYDAAIPDYFRAIAGSKADMRIEEAIKYIMGDALYFDYISGVCLKIDLSDNFLDTRLYDLNNKTPVAELLKDFPGFKIIEEEPY